MSGEDPGPLRFKRCPNGHLIRADVSECQRCIDIGRAQDPPRDSFGAGEEDSRRPPRPATNRRVWLIVAGGVLLGVVLVRVMAGGGTTENRESSDPGGLRVLTGRLTLDDTSEDASGNKFGSQNNPGSPGQTCFASSRGYSDIRTGAPVVVQDGSGDVIATTSLEEGRTIDAGPIEFLPGGRLYLCQWRFTVSIPDAEFYVVEVSHRGGRTYSRAELAASNWTVELSLG